MAKPIASAQKLVFYSAVAALLSVLFVFLGTPLLRVLRNSYGPTIFWLSGVFISSAIVGVGMGPIALWLFSIWLTIGVYSELEVRGKAGVHLAAFSTSLGVLFLFGVIYLASHHYQVDLYETVKASVNEMLAPLGTSKVINADLIIQQSPSLLYITLLVGLAFALILDRKVAVMMGLPYAKGTVPQFRLLELRLPDWMLWLTMTSLLFAFLNGIPQQISILSMNIFNIMVAGYFFQGIAILEVAFLVYRVGPLFRFLIYIFLIGQLFLLVSAVGFFDYWLDLRKKLRISLATSRKNQNNGENR